MSDVLTKDELEDILKVHSALMAKRIAGILKRNNELILEYAENCIETVTNLKSQESKMLNRVNDSFTDLEKTMLKDIEQILKRKPSIVPLPT